MRARHLAAALLVLVALPVLAGAAEVAMELPFSRRVSLASPARYTLRFSLWKEASGGSAPVWSEEKRLPVKGGKVSTRLGSVTPLDAASFGEQVWVQVERKVGDGYRKLGARTMLRVVPCAIWSASVRGGGAVPLGTVIDWWRPDDSWPVPDGCAICDGTMLDDTASPFHGELLPDLRCKFVRGAPDPASIGSTTGWDNHSHTTNISHNHAAFASASDGAHRHAWLQWWGGLRAAVQHLELQRGCRPGNRLGQRHGRHGGRDLPALDHGARPEPDLVHQLVREPLAQHRPPLARGPLHRLVRRELRAAERRPAQDHARTLARRRPSRLAAPRLPVLLAMR